MRDEIRALIRWIDSHCRPMPTRDNGDGTLTVYSIVPARNRFGDYYFDLEAQTIPATMSAARDLLGY